MATGRFTRALPHCANHIDIIDWMQQFNNKNACLFICLFHRVCAIKIRFTFGIFFSFLHYTFRLNHTFSIEWEKFHSWKTQIKILFLYEDIFQSINVPSWFCTATMLRSCHFRLPIVTINSINCTKNYEFFSCYVGFSW